MFPRDSHVFTIVPWLVTVFREVIEPSGGRTWLEEVCRWRWALRLYFLLSHAVEDAVSQLPAACCHVSSSMESLFKP